MVAILASLFALHRLYDFDLLWHVRTGAWIRAQQAIPRTDPFGGGTAGLPWLDVSWGAQWVAALIAGGGGLTALQLLAAILIGATFLVVLRRAPRTPLLLATALVAVLAAAHRFLPRPDLLVLPLTLALFALLERLPRGGRSTPLLLGLLTALWANLHGSFVLAPILVLAAGAGAAPAIAWRNALRRYGPAFACTALAPLANPRGVLIYGVLSPYLGSMLAAVGLAPKGAALMASEWTPTFGALLHDPIFPTAPFLFLVLLVAVSFLRRGRNASPERAACGAALLALALTAVRNLLPFAAAALAIVAANERDRLADARGDRDGDPFDAAWFRLAAALMVLLVGLSYVAAVATDRYYVTRGLPITTGVGFDPALVPEGAVGWLATHEAPGLLFNNYNSGSYLLYRLAPAVRIYIDARFDTTPVNRAIEAALADPSTLDAFLERERIGTIVLLHPSPESLAFLPRLTRENGWTLAWRDANTTIHVRAGAEAPLRAEALALPPAVEPAAARLDAILGRFKGPVLPAAELTDAFVSGILGDSERQRAAYRRALARAPDDPKALAYFARSGS
ncbi:MAG TPA: hypothetical protein VMQ62_11790 [Dongiaceae bacterium]|nr:hypothetical protein [Dongiaceae bacterium]